MNMTVAEKKNTIEDTRSCSTRQDKQVCERKGKKKCNGKGKHVYKCTSAFSDNPIDIRIYT